MSYTLFTDKNDQFECSIRLQGVKTAECKARLVIEADDVTLLYPGTISKNGKCTVPVSNLKRIFKEQAAGHIRLEVIADDMIFTPWDSDVIIKASKSIQIEKVEQHVSPIISVQVENVDEDDDFLDHEEEEFDAADNEEEDVEDVDDDGDEEEEDEIGVMVSKSSAKFNSVLDRYNV